MSERVCKLCGCTGGPLLDGVDEHPLYVDCLEAIRPETERLRSALARVTRERDEATRQAAAFMGEVATAVAIDARNDGWRVVNVVRAAESLAEAAAMFVAESDAATSEFNPTEGEVRAFQMMRERAAAYMKARQ